MQRMETHQGKGNLYHLYLRVLAFVQTVKVF